MSSSSAGLLSSGSEQGSNLSRLSALADFLAAYPHPAFILSCSAAMPNGGPSITPVFANQTMHALLSGQESGSVDLGTSFPPALASVDQARRFTDWAFGLNRPTDALVRQKFTLELTLNWLPETHGRVALEVVQSRVGDALVCTTIARDTLPTMNARVSHVTSGLPFTIVDKFNLRLKDCSHAFRSTMGPKSEPALLPMNVSLLTSPAATVEASPNAMNCVELCATYDWGSTSLGPRNEWSDTLSSCVSYTLANPFPTCCWWGPNLVLIYNDAYAEVSGKRHPSIFGKAGSLAWAELWELLGPTAKRALEGETVYRIEDQLFLNRLTDANLPEETYHSWTYVPVRNSKGDVEGMLNVNIEVTQKVITSRRTELLRDLSTHAGLAKTQSEFATSVMDVLQTSGIEAPFAAIYFATIIESWSDQHIARSPYVHQSLRDFPPKIQLSLRGTVGIPSGHSSMPDHLTVSLGSDIRLPYNTSHSDSTLDLSTAFPESVAQELEEGDGSTSELFGKQEGHISWTGSSKYMATASGTNSTTSSKQNHNHKAADSCWPFSEAFTSRNVTHVTALPSHIFEGFERRCWNEHAREAVVIPLAPDDSDVPDCMLVLGLNSRLAYDKSYESWIDLFRMSLNALLTAVQLREADTKRAIQLERLDHAQTAFFSNASHELRTPLTLIKGPLLDSIYLIRDVKIKEKLEIASRNVARLKRLVDNLMDFSKIAAHRLEGRFRPLPLALYTAELASLFRVVIEKAHVQYSVSCKEEHTICFIDADFWEKIVTELIANAFKYTLKGRISLALETVGDHVCLSVTDTGTGIPKADIDLIFDRFYRVNELVSLHGGTISVTSTTEEESRENHGSIFIVTIPLGKEHLDLAHIDNTPMSEFAQYDYGIGVADEAKHWESEALHGSQNPSDTSEEWDSASSSDMSNTQTSIDTSTLFFMKSDIILLVDDNADMRQYIRSLFAPYCQVLVAGNGKEALEVIQTIRPNLIIADVMMPVLDGFGLIIQLRAQPDTRLLPVVLLTAKEREESRVIEGLLSGADDYISKPFTAKELVARAHLQMQLGKRQAKLEDLFNARTREVQLLSDSLPVGIMRANGDGHVTYVNQRWRELTGLVNMELMDQWLECVHEDNLERIKTIWDAAQDQQMLSIECRLVGGCYIQGEFNRLTSDLGADDGIVVTITDLSDQKKLEQTRLALAIERESAAHKQAEEAEQRRIDADERRRRQELLIDVTSHELRQPVSAILNCSSVVRANVAKLYQALKSCHSQSTAYIPSATALRDMEDDLDGLDSIYQCGLAQERIANDVLSLSRIQLGALSIIPVDFSLVEETQRIISRFTNEVKMKHIHVHMDVGKSLDTLGVRTVRADRARFGQILTNLLSNGIKFTDMSTDKRVIIITLNVSRVAPAEGGPCVPPQLPAESPSILPEDLHLGQESVYIFVSVQDSGPGLHPEDLALLFRRFQQGSNSHNVFGGSGLGLFVSRKLCDLMDGAIDVNSIYGEGATFRFYIKALTIPISSKTPRLAVLPPPTSLGTWSGDIHVLIVEDNLINQTILNRQLKGEGFITTLANNGQQAIEQILSRGTSLPRRGHFDVVLMDCEMPVMDGMTATREIRRMEASGELSFRSTILALTGNAREGQVQSARDAGMDDVIIKPYKLDQLIRRILEVASSSL